MRIDKLYPSKFLKAADLNGKQVTVTISKLVMEEMGFGSEKESKPCLYFEKATKSLVLNRTNAMTISKLYGLESDLWTGKRITLIAVNVRAFGQMHETVRVKDSIPPAPAAAAAQAAPQVEENEIDDQEDFVDADEGHAEPRRIDPTTGEILDNGPGSTGQAAQAESYAAEPQNAASAQESASDDNPFNDDQPTNKPKTLSQAQLTRLHILGADLYGKEWDVRRPKLVESVSKGAISSSRELSPDEAMVLIRGLETRVRAKQAAVSGSSSQG